jgi:hypothetical protein
LAQEAREGQAEPQMPQAEYPRHQEEVPHSIPSLAQGAMEEAVELQQQQRKPLVL